MQEGSETLPGRRGSPLGLGEGPVSHTVIPASERGSLTWVRIRLSAPLEGAS